MKKTLVVLAAGIGSRFGGLKQLQSVGPNGEYIIDYSVYDAIKAGFNKIVFVIKEENYDIFKSTIGKRIQKQIEIKYVFQKNDIIKREKPLGTAHAIYSCKDVVEEPFMVINADDFYGYDAFEKGIDFLNTRLKKDNYGLISYKLINTLSESGEVKRGICQDKDGKLVKITESVVRKEEKNIKIIPFDENIKPYISDNSERVSMNMLVFDKNIFEYIEEKIPKYILKAKDKDTFELLIPDVISDGIKEKKFNVEIIETSSKWQGITYKDDLKEVKDYIKIIIDSNVYPKKLWK